VSCDIKNRWSQTFIMGVPVRPKASEQIGEREGLFRRIAGIRDFSGFGGFGATTVPIRVIQASA